MISIRVSIYYNLQLCTLVAYLRFFQVVVGGCKIFNTHLVYIHYNLYSYYYIHVILSITFCRGGGVWSLVQIETVFGRFPLDIDIPLKSIYILFTHYNRLENRFFGRIQNMRYHHIGIYELSSFTLWIYYLIKWVMIYKPKLCESIVELYLYLLNNYWIKNLVNGTFIYLHSLWFVYHKNKLISLNV